MLASFYGTCDASHNVTCDSKGVTGWAYLLGNGAVCWKSKAQPIVALSSTESELIAIDGAVRELRFLHKLLKDFGQQTTDPTTLAQDNMSTIHLCNSEHFNARTRHVALRYHYVGDQIRAGIIKIKYLSTLDMTADALTKPLPVHSHIRHREVLLGHVIHDFAKEL